VTGVGGGADLMDGKSMFNFDFQVQTHRRESSLEVARLTFHIHL
jgi:hypothetical protein